MAEVQLPLVLFCWDDPQTGEPCVEVVAEEFAVRQVRNREELTDAVAGEVEVVVVPVGAVQTDPETLVAELSGPGQTLPIAGILAQDTDPSAVPDDMETARMPIPPSDLRGLVRTFRKRARYEATVDRFYELATEVAEHESGEAERDDADLAALREKMDALRDSLAETEATLDSEDVRALFREF